MPLCGLKYISGIWNTLESYFFWPLHSSFLSSFFNYSFLLLLHLLLCLSPLLFSIDFLPLSYPHPIPFLTPIIPFIISLSYFSLINYLLISYFFITLSLPLSYIFIAHFLPFPCFFCTSAVPFPSFCLHLASNKFNIIHCLGVICSIVIFCLDSQ